MKPELTLAEVMPPVSAHSSSAPLASAPVITARGLTVSAEIGGATVDILRDISFSVAPGRVLGLVGESGAGKSMIGRVLSGALPQGFAISSGSLHLGTEDLGVMPHERRRALLGDRLAFIPQEPQTSLNPVLTIADQFGEHLERLGVPESDRRDRTIAALAAVKLRDPETLLGRYPFQLSGGMCQRVLIAMAFASDPMLLIADEPTTALDVSTQAHVVAIMRRLQRDRGTAMIFVTHDLRLAGRVCDEIAVLYAGEIVEIGPSAAVLEAPRHPYTRALAAANPSLDGPRQRIVSLPDQMPSVARFASVPGCRFAGRCPIADPACASAVPSLREVSPDHHVRCSDVCAGAQAAVLGEVLPEQAPHGDKAAPILRLSGLAKHYPGKPRFWGGTGPGFDALKPADLEVFPGEFVGIVGESGSGKSTLGQLVMGLQPPTGGRIEIDGIDVTANDALTREQRLRSVQFVFQDPQSALNPRRTVEHLVTQALDAGSPLAASVRRSRAEQLLRETGLSAELLGRYPSQLSGGQKQRVNIARALCTTPRLLIADEIVSGLDVSVQAQILNLLLDLRQRRQLSLLFISHDLAVVRYLCSRVIVMNRGEIVETGPVDQVFHAPQHAYTRSLIAAIPPERLDVPWVVDVEGRGGDDGPAPREPSS